MKKMLQKEVDEVLIQWVNNYNIWEGFIPKKVKSTPKHCEKKEKKKQKKKYKKKIIQKK